MPSEDNLVITSVFDGPLTGGTPKGVELYVINDINDLSAYGIGSANNGGGTDGQEFTFPAVTAAAGDYIYLASDSASFNNWFGFNSDYVTGIMSINGDDAIELFYSGSVIDVFGDIDVDGNGEPWEYMDGWAYRNNSTGPDGGSFTLANWSFSGPNALDGELLNSTAASPIPNGTYTHAGNSAINTYTMDVTAAGSMDYTFAGDFSGTDPAININLGRYTCFQCKCTWTSVLDKRCARHRKRKWSCRCKQWNQFQHNYLDTYCCRYVLLQLRISLYDDQYHYGRCTRYFLCMG